MNKDNNGTRVYGETKILQMFHQFMSEDQAEGMMDSIKENAPGSAWSIMFSEEDHKVGFARKNCVVGDPIATYVSDCWPLLAKILSDSYKIKKFSIGRR